MVSDIHEQIDTMRRIAHQGGLSQACQERIEKAERVVPNMQATMAFVSSNVRHQVSRLAWTPPQSYAMHAHRMPSYDLERVASMKTMTKGEPLCALADCLWTPLFAPSGTCSELHRVEQDRLKQEAVMLAEVFQRSSANVEWQNGSLSLRNHARRGHDHPRKRECLTAVHNFLRTRPDGTTAAERFFGQ